MLLSCADTLVEFRFWLLLANSANSKSSNRGIHPPAFRDCNWNAVNSSVTSFLCPVLWLQSSVEHTTIAFLLAWNHKIRQNELSFSTPLQSSRPKRCQCENILLHVNHFLTSTTSFWTPSLCVSLLVLHACCLRLNLFSYFLAVIMHELAHGAIKRMFFVLDDRPPRLTHSCALIRKTHACKRGLSLLYTHPGGSWGGGDLHVNLCCIWSDRKAANTEIFDKSKEEKIPFSHSASRLLPPAMATVSNGECLWGRERCLHA